MTQTAYMTEPDIGGVAGWAVDLMEHLGGVGAAVALAAENIFPPIPSEVILPLAGFTASRGTFSVPGAILWTTAGSVVGAVVLYLLGYWFGRDRLRAVVTRLPLMKIRDLDRAESWFERHGDKAVFLGRMIPLVRSLVSIPAGVERMPILRFTVLTAAGSAIWNTLFVLCGYYLGENWHVVQDYAEVAQKLVIAVIGLAVIVFVGLRVARRPRARA